MGRRTSLRGEPHLRHFTAAVHLRLFLVFLCVILVSASSTLSTNFDNISNERMLFPSPPVREDPATYHLEKVTGLFDLPDFYVGSIHNRWVLEGEGGPLAVANRALKDVKGDCFAIDIGMNDGFYTQLSATYGCHVWAFELQHSCIQLSRNATSKNGYDELVHIFHAPVSYKNNEVFQVPHGTDEESSLCDGGFSIAGTAENAIKKAHHPFAIKGYTSILTVRLDSLVPPNTYVDFLKIDVEGNDPMVLLGSERLFKTKRIKRAVIEVTKELWAVSVEEALAIYERIMSYGYKVLCVTEVRGNQDWSVMKENMTFADFKKVVPFGMCVDWEFYLLTI